MREYTITIFLGALGGTITAAFGGCDAILHTLILFMAFDYITGFIVAAVFNKSKKSKSGALKSSAAFKGIAKKGTMLLIVIICHRIDLIIGTAFVRDAIVIALIMVELQSILENASIMGVPVHKLGILQKALEVLKEKADTFSEDD